MTEDMRKANAEGSGRLSLRLHHRWNMTGRDDAGASSDGKARDPPAESGSLSGGIEVLWRSGREPRSRDGHVTPETRAYAASFKRSIHGE